ncbi:MAG: DUF6090 family protein [Maribacter sp.]|nr:DUF6090 family protein [Maribacter sp.]
MEKNKTGKYLKYAIGEIVLVVIGILIALQINNWNEQNKIHKSIKTHLSNLQQNIISDQILLHQLEVGMNENFNYADSLMMFFKTLIPFDSKTTKYLSKSMIEYHFRPNTNAIETISQSNEIPFLQPELQRTILDYYALIENTKQRMLISNEQIQNKYEVYIFNNYPMVFQKNSEWEYVKNQYKDDPRPEIKMNQEKLIADKTLEAHVIARRYQSGLLKELFSDLLDASNQVLKQLDKEDIK